MKNADQAHFVVSTYPWVLRGGGYDHGLNAGVFAFTSQYGSVYSWISFRVGYITILK